jgi:hypothetical protein
MSNARILHFVFCYPGCKKPLTELAERLKQWPANSLLRAQLELQINHALSMYDARCTALLELMVTNAERVGSSGMRRAIICAQTYAFAMAISPEDQLLWREKERDSGPVASASLDAPLYIHLEPFAPAVTPQ